MEVNQNLDRDSSQNIPHLKDKLANDPDSPYYINQVNVDMNGIERVQPAVDVKIIKNEELPLLSVEDNKNDNYDWKQYKSHSCDKCRDCNIL